MNKYILADSAGFCFGVSRSVELAENLLEKEGGCYCLGQLIHNDDVVKKLSERGMKVVDTPEEVPRGPGPSSAPMEYRRSFIHGSRRGTPQ